MTNPRALAAQIIARVVNERISLTEAFTQGLSGISDSRDRGFIQELCFGVLRWYAPLKQLCAYLVKKPLNAKDQDIAALLLIGLYQFIYLKTAAHAAVHETVQAAKALKKNWAAPLINGVLRSFQRQQMMLLKKLTKEEARYAHPPWLLKKLQQAWPDKWQAIVEANNHVPPMSLRVNRLKGSRDNYLQKLQEKGIAAQPSTISPVGIILAETCNVYSLPGFAEGTVSIQDTAAQLAAFLLRLAPQQCVLDACAAPGGKFTHILETQPDLQTCIAVDQDKLRLSKVAENLARLKLMSTKVKLLCVPAQSLQSQWQGLQFDRILLDAPCSGSGIIRRHPDIKLLRRAEDITKLAKQQLELLLTLWPLLKPKGILLYATCSVLPEENQQVIHRFLAQQTDAEEDSIQAEWGLACPQGRQIFPEIHGTDGFYYARLLKK
jgi:16S rRNA (cytosine967-C5)-methyltransferase